MRSREETARSKHKNGNNCAVSVYSSFFDRISGVAPTPPERLARSVFTEFEANPLGMSIEERVRRILTKEEWERECRECGR